MLSKLQSQEFMRNPYGLISEMRAEAALVQTRIPIIGKVWLTTNQAAASYVLKNSNNFTVRKANGLVIGLQWWMPKFIRRMASNMLSSDEPDHKRLRSVVDKAFHRRAIMDLDTQVNALAQNYSNQLFNTNRTADMTRQFSRPFPLAVICELLGLPENDREQFMEWASAVTTVTGGFSFLLALNKLRPLMRYVDGQIAAARRDKRQGLIGELVKTQDDGDQLSDDELSAMVFLLLLAGHETTTHLISGSVLTLLQHPESLEVLKADWSKLDMVVEECLRFVSPVQSSKPRYVRSDCEVEGVKLKAGDVVMPLLVAANYDPEVFDNPDVFDISRKPNSHIEFGTGIHFCLGHQLARAELKAALRVLFTDYPDLTLAIPNKEIRWHKRFGLRSLVSLPVTR